MIAFFVVILPHVLLRAGDATFRKTPGTQIGPFDSIDDANAALQRYRERGGKARAFIESRSGENAQEIAA